MISTRGLGFVQWASLTTEIIARYGLVPKPTTEDRWQDWASQVVSIPPISALTPPQPNHFKHWRDWGTRFNEVMLVIGDV